MGPTLKTSSLAPRLAVAARIVAALLGNYALCAAAVALGALALPWAFGMARGEAVLLASLLGFVLFLVTLIWAFAERSLWRVWLGLGLCTALCYGLAQQLAPVLN
jgi:hypothetical protein